MKALIQTNIVLLALVTMSAPAAEWSAYRHDERRSNTTDEQLSFPLREAWRQIPAQAPRPAWPEPLHMINRLDFDYAPHPVTGGGMVFASSTADDSVRAFDFKTGAERWHFITGGPVRFPPQFHEEKIYAGSDDGFVYCLEAATGALRWKFRAGPDDGMLIGNGRMISRWPVRTGVLVMDGQVYFAAGTWNAEGVHLCSLDAASGKVTWRNDTSGFTSIDFKGTNDTGKAEAILANPTHQGEFGSTGNTPQGAPIASGNTLLIPNGMGFPAKFNRRTGEYVAWERAYAPFPGAGGAIGGTWGTIDGDNFYAFSKHRSDILGIAGLPIGDGKITGLRSGGKTPQVNIMPPKAGSKYRPSDYIHGKGKVSAVGRNGKFHSRHAYGLAMGGNVLIMGLENAIVAEDPVPQKEIWRAPVDGIAREIAIANGHLLVGTERGVVHCFVSGGGASKPTIHAPKITPSPQASVAANGVIEQIRAAHMDNGFAMIIGDPDGALSIPLALSTKLGIINVVADEKTAAALRERLEAHALNGAHVQVVVVAKPDQLPFARYFANAVIVAGSSNELNARELYRVLRPCGGILLAPGLKASESEALIKASGARTDEIVLSTRSIMRGPLEGALDWDRKVASDQLTGGPMRVLWFGGPDTMQTQSFQQNLSGQPIIAHGRYFVLAERLLTCVDAYNGTVLWTHTIPRKNTQFHDINGVLHTVEDPAPVAKLGTGRSVNIVDDNHIHLALGPTCWRDKEVWMELDARTGEQGKVLGEWSAPPSESLTTAQSWPIDVDAKHGGIVKLASTEEGIVLTLITKDPTITALDAWDVFVDLRPLEKRCGLYERGAFQLTIHPAQNVTTPASWRKGTGSAHPTPILKGMHSSTGSETSVTLLWSELTAIAGSKPASFGFAVTLSANDGGDRDPIVRRHLFGDRMADALNNGWANVFIGAAPAAIEAPVNLGTITREMRQKANAQNLLRNPLAVDSPAALAPRMHPLTGELEPKLYRSGTGGCGTPFYSSTSRYGRSAGMLGLYDFVDDSGLRNFCGIKAGCSTPMIAALGMLIIPPEGGHCVCAFPFQTTVVMAPADKRLNEDWALFHDRPVDTLVRQAAINLGAVGDRRDEKGTLWLGFPRAPEEGMGYGFAAGTQKATAPSGVWLRHSSPGMQVPLHIEYLEPRRSQQTEEDTIQMNWMWTYWIPNRLHKEFGPYRTNTDILRIEGTSRPWIYGSGYSGIRKATFQLDFRKVLTAPTVSSTPKLDGKLSEEFWGGKADAVLPFTNTNVFFRHDANHLYIAMKRPPVLNRHGEAIAWGKAAEGDDSPVWADDSAEVFLSDESSGKVIHLGIAASGARYDALCGAVDAQSEDGTWNGNWTSAVTADNTGFTIEIAIPWKTLADAGLQKDHLGINFQMNQKDITAEILKYPGGIGRDWKTKETNGEALTYLGLEGRAHCRNFTPLGLGAAPVVKPRLFTVRLHFAELTEAKPGDRVFDVKLQGQTVLKDFDILARAGGVRKALVEEFKHVQADGTLTLEFAHKAPSLTPQNAPVISALEFYDENFRPVAP